MNKESLIERLAAEAKKAEAKQLEPNDAQAAAAIEQNHDENGVVWPASVAPYSVFIAPVNMSDNEVVQKARALHDELRTSGVAESQIATLVL